MATTNRNPRRALLVDLDGTLIDPAAGIVDCFRFALVAMQSPAPTEADLGWIIGPPLRQTFAQLLGGAARAEEALGVYRARYGAQGLLDAAVYDGVPEALAEILASGARLFLCTSKPAVYAARILDHFGLDRYFEAVYGAELDGRREDKGDLIDHILAERGLEPGDCVMWGDRKHDVIGASRRAIPTIGALWGYGGEAELRAAGAAAICGSPVDVPAAFCRFPRTAALGENS